jgi:hypothetical protein
VVPPTGEAESPWDSLSVVELRALLRDYPIDRTSLPAPIENMRRAELVEALRQVQLVSYAMVRHPISQAQWRAVVEGMAPEQRGQLQATPGTFRDEEHWERYGQPGALPVDSVSWNQCQQGLEALVVGVRIVRLGLTLTECRLGRSDLVAESLYIKTDQLQMGLGLRCGGLVGTGIQLEKQIAPFHSLVVRDMNAGDRSPHLRGDADDIGPHLGILGAGEGLQVSPDSEDHKGSGGHDHKAENPDGKADFFRIGIHRAEKKTSHTLPVRAAKRQGYMMADGRRTAARPTRDRNSPSNHVPNAPASMQASQAGK